MPYKSRAQQKFFHAAAARGEIKPSVVKEYDEATKGKYKNLPEHVSKHAEDETFLHSVGRGGLAGAMILGGLGAGGGAYAGHRLSSLLKLPLKKRLALMASLGVTGGVGGAGPGLLGGGVVGAGMHAITEHNRQKHASLADTLLKIAQQPPPGTPPAPPSSTPGTSWGAKPLGSAPAAPGAPAPAPPPRAAPGWTPQPSPWMQAPPAPKPMPQGPVPAPGATRQDAPPKPLPGVPGAPGSAPAPKLASILFKLANGNPVMDDEEIEEEMSPSEYEQHERLEHGMGLDGMLLHAAGAVRKG